MRSHACLMLNRTHLTEEAEEYLRINLDFSTSSGFKHSHHFTFIVQHHLQGNVYLKIYNAILLKGYQQTVLTSEVKHEGGSIML